MGVFAGELLVERNLPPQHAVENVGGDPAGGEAGDFRLGGGARSRHGPIIATNCVAVASVRRTQLTCTEDEGPNVRLAFTAVELWSDEGVCMAHRGFHTGRVFGTHGSTKRT